MLKVASQPVYVVKDLNTQLLGKLAIKSLQSLSRIAEISTTDPVSQFPSVFEGLGQIKGEYKIKLRPNAEPYAISTPC